MLGKRPGITYQLQLSSSCASCAQPESIKEEHSAAEEQESYGQQLDDASMEEEVREGREGLENEHAEENVDQQYGDVYEPEGQDNAGYHIDTYDDVTGEGEAGECSATVPLSLLPQASPDTECSSTCYPKNAAAHIITRVGALGIASRAQHPLQGENVRCSCLLEPQANERGLPQVMEQTLARGRRMTMGRCMMKQTQGRTRKWRMRQCRIRLRLPRTMLMRMKTSTMTSCLA